MKINLDALKALELKLAEYSKKNGLIAEYKSENMNGCSCGSNCFSSCSGSCKNTCSGSCWNNK